jgi:hypothetical protein
MLSFPTFLVATSRSVCQATLGPSKDRKDSRSGKLRCASRHSPPQLPASPAYKQSQFPIKRLWDTKTTRSAVSLSTFWRKYSSATVFVNISLVRNVRVNLDCLDVFESSCLSYMELLGVGKEESRHQRQDIVKKESAGC